MDRLFPVFPSGWSGVGLFCLRVAVLVTLTSGVASTLPIRLALAGAGVLVLLGCLTPVICSIIAGTALATAGWSMVSASPLWFESLRVHGLVAAIATALVMLGPGAYSIDARLFGWRELRVPDS
ncbi:MAG: hypothetical protein JWL71_3345 [Acidobacteria bacterium]|nr:hypothetical protein [Acidobacteriota bacterium]